MNLVLQNIEKSYDENQVLKKASFTFEKGKIYGLLGRNGAGKTTLFNCISGELEFENGECNDYLKMDNIRSENRLHKGRLCILLNLYYQSF